MTERVRVFHQGLRAVDRLRLCACPPDRRSSEYLQKFIESEIEKWAGVTKTVGVAAQ